jgi:hypothetical protein
MKYCIEKTRKSSKLLLLGLDNEWHGITVVDPGADGKPRLWDHGVEQRVNDGDVV